MKRLKRMLCRWFGHSEKEVINKAVSWAHVYHLYRCRRCGAEREETTEHVHYG